MLGILVVLETALFHTLELLLQVPRVLPHLCVWGGSVGRCVCVCARVCARVRVPECCHSREEAYMISCEASSCRYGNTLATH